MERFTTSDWSTYMIVKCEPMPDLDGGTVFTQELDNGGFDFYYLDSVNGGGEIRWRVRGDYPNNPGDREAIKHFGLTWSGYNPADSPV